MSYLAPLPSVRGIRHAGVKIPPTLGTIAKCFHMLNPYQPTHAFVLDADNYADR